VLGPDKLNINPVQWVSPSSGVMQARHHLIAAALMTTGVTVAQAAPFPLPKTSSCPLGYISPGVFVTTNRPGSSEAIQKSCSTCSLGCYTSDNYCLRTH
jgi:hypothetical protein